ncbi:MAG: amino acid adenylation domain-containing protein, partial [Phormidium sp.]
MKPYLFTHQGGTDLDLSLMVTEADGIFQICWEYNIDLFEATTIARMSNHFVTLLESIITNPQQQIWQLPILTTVEQEQLLVEWNDTQTDYPIDQCLHQLFEAQVEKTPDAVAVIFENQQLTYGELNSRANQLAHYLRSLDVDADVPVGISVERSLLMVVGILGILKAGGAYVPLDPEYPTQRLGFMLADSSVAVLLTQQGLLNRLPEHQAQTVCLDLDWQVISGFSQENFSTNVHSHNLAYVIYTSGSTGQPKGVAMNHLPLVNLIIWQQQHTTTSPGGKTLQFAPMSFDVSCQEMFSTWCDGGTLVLISEQLRRDPVALLGLLQEQAVERVFLPFVGLQQLAEVGIGSKSVLQLREIVTAGEQLQMTPAITHWLNQLRNCTLHNHYGPSESHVVTSFTLSHSIANWMLLPPIGRPIANSQIYILDSYLQPVPVGVPGELYIGGVGLARGYLNRPELTIDKFIPNPFSSEPDSRLYKTGDKAHYLPDGNIEYLGRIDNQVKIRGFRIELGEIEAILGQHPQVKAVVVIVREDSPGEKRLVAYLVSDLEVTPTTNELREYLKAKLPEYMIPSAFVFLEALPLTPNGKIDRRTLPTPDFQNEQKDKYVAPRTPVEEILAQIWTQVLKLNSIGVYDNFFELGGHSLLATQVISRLPEAFGINLPLRHLFESPTVAQLSQVISAQLQTGLGLDIPAIVPVSRDTDIPLSWAQERLWFVNQLEGKSSAYTMPFTIRLLGNLNVKALEQAFAQLVQRHEPLRTRFQIKNNQPIQIIDQNLSFTLPVINLQHLPEAKTQLKAQLTEEARKPFDLANGSVLRVKLWQIAPLEYVLLFAIHHIASDGWSMGVLIAEVSAYYRGMATGTAIELPALPIQYADYAVWQRQWLTNQVLERQLTYWKQQLTGAPPLLELPTDRPRPAVQTFRGGVEKLQLNSQLSQQLKQLSRTSGTTLFMTLLAGFVVLMSRYSGQTDLVIGSPIANRHRQEIEGLIGFFVNTLSLRFDLSTEPTFESLLAQVKQVTQNAYEHQDLPFEMLVEQLQVERNLDRNPLVQVVFALQNAPSSPWDLPGVRVEEMATAVESVRVDLEVHLWDESSGLGGFCCYNRDLFDRATIIRMMQHFQMLLAAIVENSQQSVALLPMLTTQERHQLLIEWNNTQTDYPVDKCLHQLFEEQVEKTPDAVALVFEEQQLTYAQLNIRANKLAHYLRYEGVGADVLVGICVERSIEMIVGILGILKAGGAYLPLDPEYPRERLHFILEDAGISLLLTQSFLLEQLPHIEPKPLNQILCLDELTFSEELTSNPQLQTTADHLAYVIYTSGSTGKPKGVMIEHRAIVNLSWIWAQTFQVQSSSRLLQFGSFSFDLSVAEIATSLVSGASLYLEDKETLLPSQTLVDFLLEHRITHSFLSASALSVLPEADLPDLQCLTVGGEACPPQLASFWGLGRQFYNCYGPTESTVTAAIALIQPNGEKPPIGKPVSNLRIYILDKKNQPLPLGIPGELCIAGVGLARGYLNRPDLTEEKFIEVNLCGQIERIYKTGDLARYLPDGNIEYLGRIDNQVKIRGFRIELGEIEAILIQHPQVQSSVVIARVDNPGEKRLVAYLVSDSEVTPTTNELREYLKAKLPEYMIPSAFVFLLTLPLTPNGKIDRRALKAPDFDNAHTENYVAPRTPIEEILTHLFSQVLKLNQVGIYDNFFELGGHSLLATQLISRIRSHLQVELPLRSLFSAPTITELASNIQQLQTQNLQLNSPPIVKRNNNSDLPLSFAQTRLWFIDQFQPNSALYNIPLALRIKGRLQIATLEQSLTEIVQRHEALRTNFITIDGQANQIIHAENNGKLIIVDLQHLGTTEQEIAAQEVVQQETVQTFDLANDSLMRTTLIKLGETEHILIICMHHIISDGWSMGVFVQELAALYKADTQNQPSLEDSTQTSLTPLPIQYPDFALWQRQWLQGEILQTQLTYWKQQLADAPALLSLPTDRKRPSVQTYRGAHQKFDLSVELTEKLTQLSQEQGVTLFMTLLAGFNTLLYRYTGESDIVVGSPIANRNHSEIERLIGFFVNTLVLRTDLSENPSFTELINRTREVCLAAYTHQDLPFEMLVEAVQPTRDLSYSPQFQVMFVLQNAPVSELELSGLTLSPKELEMPISKFDLTLSMENTPHGLIGVWEYNTDLFDSSTIGRITSHFQTLLEAIVENPSQPISQLPILTTVEQQQLLVEWNDTQTDYPVDKCIHQLFEEQVEKTPDAVAIIFENQQLTYAQLNIRANQLAHYLRYEGVDADVLVGICVERSIEMIVGILGILKAGGAYLPLDPEYPAERLHLMLYDSQVSLLLTQQWLLEKLPQSPTQLVLLDEAWSQIAQYSLDNPTIGVGASHLANVIYTSGSTGKPKGVMVEHQGLCNLAIAQIQTFGLNSDSRVLQFASFSFDASIWEVLMAFGSGATLYLGSKETLMPGEPLIKQLRDDQITHVTLPPSALAVLPTEELPALSTLIVAGEACAIELMQQWSVGRKFYNAYGPTEASVCATIAQCADHDPKISIGRPIVNTQIYILDQYLQPLPIGVPGELHIGGAGLARGYLNARELTDEKFIPHPFNNQSNSRLYKTGDLARYLPDGNIEYLGRIDNQVKIRGFRIELGEIEAVLSQHPQIQTSVVIARVDNPGEKRLVAYLVSDSEITLTTNELREYLKAKLPEYMIPSAFVFLEALPLTPNGKVDRRALPKPESRSGIENSLVLPRTPVEETLATIWKQVLRVGEIGIHDNFFQLGGDSILSIQIISRAKKAGLELTVKQLFSNQTIAELAAVAGVTKAIEISQELVTGKVELTPIQQWFLEQNWIEPHHFNQSFLLTTPSNFQPELLKPIWQQLLLHHDALRLRFTQTESGWEQIHATPNDSIAISCFDLSNLPENEIAITIENTANSLQASLNLAENLVQVAYFNLGENQPGRLLIVIHHLVVDGVSWRILLEDLQTAYQQLSQGFRECQPNGQPIGLPPKTTSFQDWAKHLQEYARTEVLKSELSYWLSDYTSVSPIPVDYPQGENTVASANYISVSLNEAETQALLQDVPKAYKTQINDVLLTALVLVLSKWTNSQTVLFNLEGHGREDIIEGVDLSRTVSWFTTIFPVAIELETTDNLGEALKSVKEQLRQIPHKGIGYGLLRYLSGDRDIQNQLETKEKPEITFNYLGQFSQIFNQNSLLQLANESSGNSQSLQGKRSNLLDINSIITNEQLHIDWTYSTHVHYSSTIEQIAQEFIDTLRELIIHCLSPENGGYTPSDFPLVKLSQIEIDRVLATSAQEAGQKTTNWQNIEDIYPLSPMQQGMLFESLYAPESGVYFEQMTFSITGNLNVSAFEQAWQQIVAHHSIFRTAFVWESLPQPVQLVFRQVNVNIVTYDWQNLSANEQQQQLEEFLESDRQLGFSFSPAPLMRLYLIQTQENTYQFVWSFHHILLDGWSLPLVLKDLWNFYQVMLTGKTLDHQSSLNYRQYIAWLQQQDVAQSEAFWQQKLASFSAPTPLMIDKPLLHRENGSASYGQQHIELSLSATVKANNFVREHQLTLSNLVQATWALLLSRYSQESDVVFGATVSGRPPVINGVESMVGLFINTLPMRVRFNENTKLLEILKDLQAQLVESEQFSYSSLVEIQGFSNVPRGTSLFDSILVFENYPIDSDLLEDNSNFSFSNFRAIEHTNYPLTILVGPSEQLFLKVSYDTNCFDDDAISRMLGHFVTLLEAIVANPETPISHLPMLTPSEQQQILIEWNNTQTDYPIDQCLHQLFEAQVEKTPDAVAVIFENQQLTYRELNNRANQLAHY